MKVLFLLLAMASVTLAAAQDLNGSWELISENEKPVALTTIRIYQDGFFAEGTKEGDYNFKTAKGGAYELNKNAYSQQIQFNSEDSKEVGSIKNFVINRVGDTLTLKGEEFSQSWLKTSTEKNDLTGVWIITGRERDGEMQKREIADRKTIKILSGDRFQWIAYNSATGEFFATGGGFYSANYGRYIENIEFFSKDDIKVGASLNFDYQLMNKEWHHRGKSSDGDPIYEIWSPFKAEIKRK